MTNNSTTTDSLSHLPLYSIYLILGLSVGGSNWCIVFAILKYKALRRSKEHLIVMGLSLADALCLSGFIFAGLYRMNLKFEGIHDTKFYTAWDCMLKPHNLLWAWTPTLSALMLTVVSVDRTLLVALPFRYLTWSSSYAKLLLSIIYGFCFCTGMAFICMTWHTRHQPPTLAAVCFTEAAISPQITSPLVASYYASAPPFFAALSVIIYIFLWFVYKRKKNLQVGGEDNQAQEIKLKRQRRLTVTLGICCACTFLVFCVPNSIGQINWRFGGPERLSMFCWLLSNCNPLCNAFIYPMRHREIGKALRGLFTCKQMPPVVSMWGEATPRHRK